MGPIVPFSTFDQLDSFFLQDYSPVGLDVGLSTEFEVAPWLNVYPGLSYNFHPFDHFNQTVFTEERAIGSSGQPIQLLLFYLNCRLTSSSDTNTAKPFFLLGGGYVMEHRGNITVDWQNLLGQLYTTEIGPNDYQYWAFSVGIGYSIRITERLILEPSIVARSNARDRIYEVAGLNVLYNFSI